jgi:hypothetical protein
MSMECRPNSLLGRGKYNYLYSLFYVYVIYSTTYNFNTCFKMPEQELGQQNTAEWYWPTYPYYSTNNTRMQSYSGWSAISKRKREKLSIAGFFYTGNAPHR